MKYNYNVMGWRLEEVVVYGARPVKGNSRNSGKIRIFPININFFAQTAAVSETAAV